MKNLFFIFLFNFLFFADYLSATLLIEGDGVAPYQAFKPGHDGLSPINGLLTLKSGTLNNVRFHGNFGANDPRYLCHYTISQPSRHNPTSGTDSPGDFTCSVVQQLFPSAAGGSLTRPAHINDFFYRISHKRLGQLIVLYHTQALLEKPQLHEFQHFFLNSFGLDENGNTLSAKKVKKNDHKVEHWFLNSSQRKSLVKLWARYSPENLAKTYAETFFGTIYESEKYPRNFVVSTLLAFGYLKAQSIDDLVTMSEAFRPFMTENSALRVSLFQNEFYKNWLSTLDKCHSGLRLNEQHIDDLLSNPDKWAFLTLCDVLKGGRFPNILGTASAYHTYFENDEVMSESFSDCGEVSLRCVLNILLADPETRTFDLSTLETNFPQASSRLLQFYKGNPSDEQVFAQRTYDDVNHGVKGRSAWADVVSGLNIENDPNPVKYRSKSGRCNIAAVGIDNMLRVLSKILGDDYSSLQTDSMTEGEIWAAKLTYLLEKLSRPGYQITWKIKDKPQEEPKAASSLKKYPKIVILINDEEAVCWSFEHGHFDSKEPHSGSDDGSISWRSQLVPFSHKPSTEPWDIILSKTQRVNTAILSQICAFYKKMHSYDKGAISVDKSFVMEEFYGYSVEGMEDLLDVYDLFIPLCPDEISQVIKKNFLKLRLEDDMTAAMALCLSYKHRSFFEDNIFTGDNGEQLKSSLDAKEKSLKSKNILDLCEDLHYQTNYADEFIYKYVSSLEVDDIVN